MSVAFLLWAASAAAAAPGAGLDVRDAWVAEPVAGRTITVAYFVLENGGADDLLLTGCEAPVAEVAEIHRVTQSDGRMSMGRVEQVAVAAGERVAFEPGGYHVMLIGLREPLAAGQSVELRLAFGAGDDVVVQAPVRRREER